MSPKNSQSSEVPVSTETEQLAVTDENQLEESKPVEEKRVEPRQKRRLPMLLGVIGLIAGLGVGGYWWQSHASRANSQAAAESQASQPKAVAVKLNTLETTTVQDTSEFVAKLDAPRSAVLKTQVDGRISQILVREGDRIRPGQVIFSLDSEDLQARLLQARAAQQAEAARLAELQAGSRPEEIAQAKAKLAQAEARLQDAQAGARPEEIAQAQSQIEAAQADVELTRERLNRYRQLSAEGAISRDTLSEYIRGERSATAKLQEAQRRLSELRQSRRSDITELAAAAEQERQNLKQLQKGPRSEEIDQARAQLAQAQAQVRVADVELQDTKVVAPFAGVVGAIPVKIGDFVSKGNDLTTITKNDVLEVNLPIPLRYASQVRLGLPVEILDTQGKALATAQVSFISPNISADTQSILVKASFTNNNSSLLNSQSVRARVIWSAQPGVLIPVTSVTRIGGETFVFVAENGQKSTSEQSTLVARQKAIKLGAIQGENYQVIDGLKAGEQIIVSGLLNLRDGVPVTPVSELTK